MHRNALLILALVFATGLAPFYFWRQRDACPIPVLAGEAVPSGETPLFCNTKALSAEERHRHTALTKKLFAAVLDKRELRDGIAFRLNQSVVSLADLVDWIEGERKCCPFLDFRLSLARERGAIELALTGREGVKQLLLTLFTETAATR